MVRPSTPDAASVQQVIALLYAGGTPRRLEDCDYLSEALNSVGGDRLRGDRRRDALRALVEAVLATDKNDSELLAIRDYLGWGSHSYEEVIEAAKKAAKKAGVARIKVLKDASEDTKEREKRKYLAGVGVREVFAGSQLEPEKGLSNKTVRNRRKELARTLIRAFDDFMSEPTRVQEFARKINPGVSTPSTASQEFETLPLDVISQNPYYRAGIQFLTSDSETLYIIGTLGRRTVYTSRRIRPLNDSLREFYDYYYDLDDSSRFLYKFVADYGCKLESVARVMNPGTMVGRFSLSRPLKRGFEHTICYHIGRIDSASDLPDFNPFILTRCSEQAPRLQERILVRFDESFGRPKRAWWLVTTRSRQIPGMWTEECDLVIDDQGCVEWEVVDMEPNLYDAVCWDI
jgi:hypothetical protein